MLFHQVAYMNMLMHGTPKRPIRWNPTANDITIPYKDKFIPAIITQSKSEKPDYGIILTHGAGGDMNLTQLSVLARQLAGNGFQVVRFTCKGLNLQYRVNVYKEVLAFMGSKAKSDGIKGYFLSGRSMGARAAVGVCNDIQDTSMESFVLGVICISYPLHPPKDIGNLRDGPLLQLHKHSLFVSGDSDNMCNKDLMEKVISKVPYSKIVWIADADHGLKVKREPEAVTVENFGQEILEWARERTLSKEMDTKSASVNKGKRIARVPSTEPKQDCADMVKTDEKRRKIKCK